jgi:uncharacterized protein
MPHAPPLGLIHHLRQTFQLDWHGIHGAPHWARVQHNGLRLAEDLDVDRQVVSLFAFLHDHRRVADRREWGHGLRAAAEIAGLNQRLELGLTAQQVQLLEVACAGHSDGQLDGDLTVQVCWDADRLDLGRVFTRPRPERLCTEVARQPEVIAWAWQRSRGLDR